MFELWMLYIILAAAAVLAEIFAPSFFCINFALAAVITAVISLYINSFNITMTIFIVLSLLAVLFLRPVLIKHFRKDKTGDFNDQYIGKIVKTIEPVTESSGAVSIYDERWEARVRNNSASIEAGADVKITGHESLILFVEKI